MKNVIISASLLILCASMPARADNMAIEEAIKSRPDLSIFYRALVNTGVNHELQPGTSYTIFAPTNAAFAEIRQDKYPCFYKAQCRAEVAQIVRNHIVTGNLYIDDAQKQKGGYYSVGGRFVSVGQPSRNNYAVDGKNIVYMSSVGSNIIYKIDGLIAKPRELGMFQGWENNGAPVQQVTTTKRTIADPACGPGGCPDATTQITTITRTVVVPANALPPTTKE